jgi:hypothetical protein
MVIIELHESQELEEEVVVWVVTQGGIHMVADLE